MAGQQNQAPPVQELCRDFECKRGFKNIKLTSSVMALQLNSISAIVYEPGLQVLFCHTLRKILVSYTK